MKNTITTTDIASVIGIDPYKTPVDVYREKVGEAEAEVSEAMEIGSALKEVAKRVWESKSGKTIVEVEEKVKGHSSAKVDGTVDGQPIMVVTSPVAWDEIPEVVNVKAQHQMGLEDSWKKMTVVCMVTGYGKAISVYEIARDEEAISVLQNAAESFWAENVEKKVAPAPVNVEDCRKIWGRNEEGTSVEADEATAEAVANLKAVSANIKALEAEEEALKKTIMSAMGSNEVLTVGGKKAVSWKCNKDSVKVDYKGLVESLAPAADILAEHTSTVPGARVFRVSK